MKSILDKSVNEEMQSRINSLETSDAGLWGKMNVNQMICHLSDALKMGLGIKKTKFVGNFFLTKIMKNLILWGVIKAPKGKVKTVPELKQGAGGTPPKEFLNDKNELLDLVTNFSSKYPNNTLIVHPAFGAMSKQEWGRLAYTHIEHHLQQFGR